MDTLPKKMYKLPLVTRRMRHIVCYQSIENENGTVPLTGITDDNKCWRACGTIETLIHLWCKCQMVQPFCGFLQN